jgi:hypothetical protein
MSTPATTTLSLQVPSTLLPRQLGSGTRQHTLPLNSLLGNIPARANGRLKLHAGLAALTGVAAYGIGSLLHSRLPRPQMSEEQRNTLGWTGLGLAALGSAGMISGNVVIDRGTDLLRMGYAFPNHGFKKSGWAHVGLGMLGGIAGAAMAGRGVSQMLTSQRAVVPPNTSSSV